MRPFRVVWPFSELSDSRLLFKVFPYRAPPLPSDNIRRNYEAFFSSPIKTKRTVTVDMPLGAKSRQVVWGKLTDG